MDSAVKGAELVEKMRLQPQSNREQHVSSNEISVGDPKSNEISDGECQRLVVLHENLQKMRHQQYGD